MSELSTSQTDFASSDNDTQEVARSNRREVRNPVLGLPAHKRLLALPPDSRAALRAVLIDLRDDARHRAEASWKSHKGPLALYWKCVGVYANHVARVLASAA